jgi:hypothetical protein
MTTSYDDYRTSPDYNPNEFKIWVYISIAFVAIMFATVLYFAAEQRDEQYRKQQTIEQIRSRC